MATLINSSNLTLPLTQKIFARGASIELQQNVIWLIQRGAVRTITVHEDGKQIVLGYWGAGDVVGQPLSRIMPYQIECLTSVEAAKIPAFSWDQVLNSLILHSQQTEEFLSIVQLQPVSLRLWKFLLWLSQKFGRDIKQGRLIDLRLTHQELSEVVNVTRVTVTRTLQQFEEEGKLLRGKKQLILI